MTTLVYPPEPAPRLPRPTASSNPEEDTCPDAEMLPVVEESGVVVAQASRCHCHKNGLLHPVVHLHIIDREGRLFLQKRSKSRETWPGRWDSAVGGHVSYGESLLEALFREAGEEIGFTSFNPVSLGCFTFKGATECEQVHIFAAVGHFDLHPRSEEVSDGRWWEMREIEDNLGKSVFTPNFEEDFARVRHSLEALL